VLQAALQAAWAEILVETASSFHGLDSPSKAALSCQWGYNKKKDKICHKIGTGNSNTSDETYLHKTYPQEERLIHSCMAIS
jgi:hypothetical protein